MIMGGISYSWFLVVCYEIRLIFLEGSASPLRGIAFGDVLWFSSYGLKIFDLLKNVRTNFSFTEKLEE
jgi:hypothetical protein